MSTKILSCAGCHGAITTKQYLTCRICALVYDLECANVSEKRFYSTSTGDKRNVWECPGCVSRQPKVGNINTPVGAVRGSEVRVPLNPRQESPHQAPVPDMFHGVLQGDDDSIILGSHLDQTASGYVNSRVRRQALNQSSTVAEISCVEDTVCLDNIRTIMREELQHLMDERLTNVISNIVVDQVTVAVQIAVAGVTDRLAALEKRVADLEDDSLSRQQLPVNGFEQSREMEQSNVVDAAVNTLKVDATIKTKSAKRNLHKSQAKPASLLENSAHVRPAVSAKTKDIPVNVSSGSDWTEIKKRRRSPEGVTRGTAAPGALQLEACERKMYLHLYFVKIGTTDAQVRSHLTYICGADVCAVEVLKARGEYASFKLIVPSKFTDKIMLPESWPEGVCVKPWRQNFRANNQKEQLSQRS